MHTHVTTDFLHFLQKIFKKTQDKLKPRSAGTVDKCGPLGRKDFLGIIVKFGKAQIFFLSKVSKDWLFIDQNINKQLWQPSLICRTKPQLFEKEFQKNSVLKYHRVPQPSGLSRQIQIMVQIPARAKNKMFLSWGWRTQLKPVNAINIAHKWGTKCQQ